MVLRGTVADLGELRCALASYPNGRAQLELDLQKAAMAMNAEDNSGGYRFDDVDNEEEMGQIEQAGAQSDGALAPADTLTKGGESENDEAADNKNKRTRDENDDGSEDGEDMDEDEVENQEQLLFYLSSVQCTCSSWNMENVPGDFFVTTVRILFLPETAQADDGKDQAISLDDVAIDGSCIALHAVDSLPVDGEDDETTNKIVSHHVYCQIAEPMGDDGDNNMGGMGMGMGMGAGISMLAPTQIGEEGGDIENEDEVNSQDIGGEDNGGYEDDGTIEVYFKPTGSEKDGDDSQSNKCQNIFNSLTKLASLNPVEGDSGGGYGGGGLFSMLSLMAGIENGGGEGMMVAGLDEDDDDMVVRLGGSNTLVENDDEGSEGAPEEERQAMLQRLDDMLVVPPEYEIPSDNEGGQFDDADEEDDEIL